MTTATAAPSILTFRQFVTRRRQEARAEYGISHRDAATFYPDTLLRPEYVHHVTRQVAAGGRPTAAVLRTWDGDLVYFVRKFGDAPDIVKPPAR